MGGSSSTTIGHKYFLGVQMALAHGPLDNINRIEVDRRIAWEGVNTGTSIEVDAPGLFGGDKKEGGVSGTVDIDMGLPTQGQNSYLQSVLGNDLPAFRGVACAVLNQCYMGNNPYLKPWAFRAHRTLLTTNGEDQWYATKSGIGCTTDPGYVCNAFETAAISEADHYWPMDGNASWYDTGGGGSWALRFYADKGTDCLFAGPTLSGNFPEDTIVEEACINGSWYVDSSGLVGPSHVDHTNLDVPDGQTKNYSHGHWNKTPTITSNGVSRPLFFSQLDIKSNTQTLEGPYVVISNTKTSGGDHVVRITIGGLNGDTVTGNEHTDVNWTTIGANHDDPHWYHLDVDISYETGTGPYPATYTWFTTITATVYVDGELAGSSTRTSDNSHPNYVPDTTLYHDGASTCSVELVTVGSPNGYFNSMYFKTPKMSTVQREALESGWDQNQAGYSPSSDCVCADMNPAHIVRECLTDTSWGMGYSANDIDDTAFMAAADTLYTEQMGMSILWHKEAPLEDFIGEILRHIDAVLFVDRTNGKFVLNLVRDDYQNDSTLVVLDDTNVASVTNAKRPTTGELTSSVTVDFWDRDTGETGSVTEHNWPLIQIQGAQTHTTIQYPGFTNYTVAQQAALRDLASLSTPLLACRIEAGREAAELNVGDAFILDWPDLDIDSLVMRVQQMTLGDNRDNTIVIEAVEDSFALPVARSEAPEDGLWTDPTEGTPQDSVPRVVMEAPYYEVVRVNGQLDTDNIIDNNNGAGFILAAGGRQGSELNASLHVDSGSGYVDSDQLEFSPYAYLTDPIGETDTVISITGAKDLDLVSTSSIAQIGNELVRVDELITDSNGNYTDVVVGRGILDTVPGTHGLDSNTLDSNHTNLEDAIIFWDEDASSDDVEYSASESVNVKIQTVLGSSTQDINLVPVDSFTMASRAFRPYPPGNLQIDGEGYPESNTSTEIYFDFTHLITWAHRDRLQQTDGNLYDYTTGDIGPEVGTTYRIDIYSTLQDGTTSDPWWTTTVSGNSYQMDSNTDTSRGEPPENTETVHIKVTSMRDGYDSHQSPVATLSYLSDSSA